MSDNNNTNNPAGSVQSPAGTSSEPGMTDATATGGISDGGQTANSGAADAQGHANDDGQSGGSSVSAEFEAWLEASNADPSQSDTTSPDGDADGTDDAPAQATATDDAKEPDAVDTAAQEKPEAKKEDDLEPTAEESAAKRVPLKKLTRALEDRRQLKTERENLTRELEQERQITDRVIDTFEAAGIQSDRLMPFLGALAKAKVDPTAAAQVREALGMVDSPAIDIKALRQAIDSYDVEAIDRMLAPLEQRQQAKPAQAEQRKQPATEQQAQQRQPAAQPFSAVKPVLAEMGDTIRATFKDAAGPMIHEITQGATKQLKALETEYGVAVTDQAVVRVFKEHRDRVVDARMRALSATKATGHTGKRPPTHLPPARVASGSGKVDNFAAFLDATAR